MELMNAFKLPEVREAAPRRQDAPGKARDDESQGPAVSFPTMLEQKARAEKPRQEVSADGAAVAGPTATEGQSGTPGEATAEQTKGTEQAGQGKPHLAVTPSLQTAPQDVLLAGSLPKEVVPQLKSPAPVATPAQTISIPESTEALPVTEPAQYVQAGKPAPVPVNPVLEATAPATPQATAVDKPVPAPAVPTASTATISATVEPRETVNTAQPNIPSAAPVPANAPQVDEGEAAAPEETSETTSDGQPRTSESVMPAAIGAAAEAAPAAVDSVAVQSAVAPEAREGAAPAAPAAAESAPTPAPAEASVAIPGGEPVAPEVLASMQKANSSYAQPQPNAAEAETARPTLADLDLDSGSMDWNRSRETLLERMAGLGNVRGRTIQRSIQAQVSQRVVDHLTREMGKEQLTIRLNPGHLGQVEIRFQAQDDQLTIVMNTDGRQAEQALSEGARDLAETIGDKSSRFQVVDIRVENRGPDAPRHEPRQEERREKEQPETGQQHNQHQGRGQGQHPQHQTGADEWAAYHLGG